MAARQARKRSRRRAGAGNRRASTTSWSPPLAVDRPEFRRLFRQVYADGRAAVFANTIGPTRRNSIFMFATSRAPRGRWFACPAVRGTGCLRSPARQGTSRWRPRSRVRYSISSPAPEMRKRKARKRDAEEDL